MSALLNVSNVIQRLVLFVGRAGSLFLLPLIAAIIFDVVTRRTPFLSELIRDLGLQSVIASSKLQEWEWHFHGIVLFTALGMSYLKGAQVRIDILRARGSVTTSAVIEMVGIVVFFLPFVVTVIWFGWDFVMRAYTSGEASMNGLSHRWIIKSFLLVGMTLCLLAGVTVLLRVVAFLFGEKSLAETDLSHLLKAEEDR